ncbi:MAG: hypothetical protein FRX49_01384 [Trebouxia sp. A1-2]|nr:MAG: hypothetical protein FRX49_01384 [Trebouxia sp. A1-2]
MSELSTPEEAVSPASGAMPVDCTDWSLSPLFAGVPLVPAVKDSARLPMGEGARVRRKEKEKTTPSVVNSPEANAGASTLSLKVRSSLWAVATSALAASTLSCTVSSSRCRCSCSSRTALALISRAAFLPSAVAISCNSTVEESNFEDPLECQEATLESPEGTSRPGSSLAGLVLGSSRQTREGHVLREDVKGLIGVLGGSFGGAEGLGARLRGGGCCHGWEDACGDLGWRWDTLRAVSNSETS